MCRFSASSGFWRTFNKIPAINAHIYRMRKIKYQHRKVRNQEKPAYLKREKGPQQLRTYAPYDTQVIFYV